MAMASKQHHLLLGLGAQQRILTGNLKLSTLSFRTEVQRRRSLLCPTVSALQAPSPASPDDTSPRNESKPSPPPPRRRGQIPPEWEELTRPVPEPPNYLLWAAGFCLVFLTRQAIAEELLQWASVFAIAVLASIRFTQKLLTLLMVKLLQIVKVPVSWVLILAGWMGIFARDLYSLIIKTTSIWPTTKALLLVTLVLSIGEATNVTAVSGQPWSFVMASALGVGVVWMVIHPLLYLLLLVLLTGYALFAQKKDMVTAALPATTLLVVIGEAPLKAVALASFLASAIYTHWRTPKEERQLLVSTTRTVQPTLMVIAALFVGITAGSRFISARHSLWLAKG